MSKQNQNTTLAELTQAIVGVNTHFPTGTIMITGKAFTAQELTSLFQGLIDAIKAATAATAARKKAVANVKTLKASVLPVYRDLIGVVELTLGRDPTLLADFGKQTVEAKTPTAGTKAAAVQKRKSTRVARHTMGSVQKKDVTGAETPPAQPSASGSATTAPKPAS